VNISSSSSPDSDSSCFRSDITSPSYILHVLLAQGWLRLFVGCSSALRFCASERFDLLCGSMALVLSLVFEVDVMCGVSRHGGFFDDVKFVVRS